MGTVNSISENQQSHGWIPEMLDFITLVYDSSYSEPLYFCVGETTVIGHLRNIYCLKYNRIHRVY